MVMYLPLKQIYPSSILGRPTYSEVTRVVMACTVNALFAGSIPAFGAKWKYGVAGNVVGSYPSVHGSNPCASTKSVNLKS